MVSSVRSRPNHYQMLGLTPAASDDEIKQAFTTKMGLFGAHPLGEAAQLCIAYETLRNPGKRRDYDRSLGLTPVPQGQQWGFGLPQKRWRPFIAAAALDSPVEQPSAPPAEPHVTLNQEEPEEARVASFIAASLRDLARPMAVDEAPAPTPQPRPEPKPERRPEPRLEPRIEEILAARPIEQDSFGYAEEEEERTFDLKRPAIAVGGFVVAAGLIGAVSGLSLKDDVQSAGVAEPAVTVAVPEPKQTANVSNQSDSLGAPEPRIEQPAATYASAPTNRRTAQRQRMSSWVQQQVQDSDAVETAPTTTPPVELASDQVASDPLAPKPVEASMPLPSKVIARTIERIGYSCGSVSSTSAVEGASGVYNVTCSSGQTYQATPVHGRYRFRKSSSH